MDLAYDHIQESSLPKDADKKSGDTKNPTSDQPQHSLNDDLQEAYKAISSSAWGIRIGGFLGNAVKQGQEVYKEASKEVTELGEDAAKGFTSIISRTRSLTVNAGQGEPSGDRNKEADGQTTPTKTRDQASDEAMSSSSENYLARLRSEAAKRLKDLQKAEDAADEALLRFGTNISNFLKEAVSIAPPSDSNNQGSTVLFESKDAQGKRVIHASRQDAQLHVIHTSTESFAKDPATDEFATWAKTFDVEKKTADISDDLNKYPELRTTMEKLVPDQVPYAEFWKRYYFLRHGLEAAETRRRDLLKAASAEDEVGWDDDSEDEAASAPVPAPAPTPTPKVEQKQVRPPSAESSTTIQPPAQSSGLKPAAESRKSNDEKSQADSDTSYDVVGATSGVPSQAPNSPKDSRKVDDSDDDWE
ncbi:BSD domain-containing protein [Colletotrichum graminicola]|uniref:BSD domain-containing protein n=1 Tax=Colletotrichum graminicola (strain M1.001 / M2 / FGSC 10212) TaxID=645133 RepID=E3QH83_COLGM|nr:BSD domain-containing protein [Colletotrichum graminicola M1.001]EFQ30245.1 BSD domain-containing protein [Colletotrichum graminicola M1.001]WDK09081.1 BSD domain-containing protein [Colletotrichum graminicola]